MKICQPASHKWPSDLDPFGLSVPMCVWIAVLPHGYPYGPFDSLNCSLPFPTHDTRVNPGPGACGWPSGNILPELPAGGDEGENA